MAQLVLTQTEPRTAAGIGDIRTEDIHDLLGAVRRYLPDEDLAPIESAYRFAALAHAGQLRRSGQPYLSHPYAVARILTQYSVDVETLVGALLHDTVEDSATTLDDIEAAFGASVRRLVDGVTKVDRIRLRSSEEAQAESLHKMMLATARDVRVLIIKLGDRLHNMRTIDALDQERRTRIATDSLRVFAPLAARIGMHEMREELEDLAFKVLNPKARDAIMRRFVQLKARAGSGYAAHRRGD